jgi:hypothetical protein
MERLVRILQIKTPRSARVFLFGSVVMFLWGVYILLGGLSRSGHASWGALPVLAPWFLISASYIAIALWALVSARGQQYLAIEEERMATAQRNWLWYGKFLFACYAAAFASFMLLGVLALPFAEYRVLEAMFRPYGGYYLLGLGLLWAPLIFRYLK